MSLIGQRKGACFLLHYIDVGWKSLILLNMAKVKCFVMNISKRDEDMCYGQNCCFQRPPNDQFIKCNPEQNKLKKINKLRLCTATASLSACLY